MAAMIDLNADLGEGVGDDLAMLQIVTSASIACGGHAGDETTMRTAIRGAIANNVAIGAHPGFADREHFGRRRLDLPIETICNQVVSQIETLDAIAHEEGGKIAYLKLHGALANMAAEDIELASAVFSAASAKFPGMAILALAGSAQAHAAHALGLDVVPEAYADRAYTADGLLAPRTLSGSVLEDERAITERCLRLAEKGEIVAIDGTVIRSDARSICVHGDTPGAVVLACAVREALKDAGFMAPRSGRQLPLR